MQVTDDFFDKLRRFMAVVSAFCPQAIMQEESRIVLQSEFGVWLNSKEDDILWTQDRQNQKDAQWRELIKRANDAGLRLEPDPDDIFAMPLHLRKNPHDEEFILKGLEQLKASRR